MERRNIKKIYLDLVAIDSLDNSELKAISLQKWADEFLTDEIELELTEKELQNFMEMFYKNIKFLKKYVNQLTIDLEESKNIKKFLEA